ncbi:hypothetical protein HDU91_006133, partial [Kappamyces sp. JEL0680]
EGNFYSFHAGVSKITQKTRDFSIAMQQLENIQEPVPPAPQPVVGGTKSFQLRWFGSAWATGYQITRVNPDGSKTLVASNASDNKDSGQVLFADSLVSSGQYKYEIRPISISGKTIDNVFTIGPLSK